MRSAMRACVHISNPQFSIRMRFKFHAKVVPSGNATAVEVPKDGIESFGAGARPPVAISINGHTWRSRIAVKDGKCLVGISAANRQASSISEGDVVEVFVELDEAPRTVPEPPDLAEALKKSKHARAAFDGLPFGLKRKHVAAIEDAKSLETRQRRIAKLVSDLQQGAV
ncbi:YdeI/OmpD-associated family protein [Variovorax sp. Sphag1AA]|uniref:YdeI/OmpD-associated family protein n=1 Tax=Variovorax sp. Sphag1AA TaxID=2587027 RepID=UPI0017E8AFBA|nr:YdeI/OmpD-associated family protein [Variovorax sp. Sphag1AA]MBB3178032.1 hypothetical protein [Variovorax sp. Sphag1AA]